MATSWTQADVVKLERAIRTGALQVRYDDGRSVTYRSLEEMFAILDRIKGELEVPQNRGPLRKVMAHSKGLQSLISDPDDFGP